MVSYHHVLYAPDLGEVFIVKNQVLIMWKVKWGLGVWGVVQLRPIYIAKFKRKKSLFPGFIANSTLYKPCKFCYLINKINVENGIMVKYISHQDTLEIIFEIFKIVSENIVEVADVAVTRVGLGTKRTKA